MPIKTEDFAERRDAIRQILASRAVHNQAELQRQLARKGYPVTQSSVSRDLQELKVIKVDGKYVLAESLVRTANAPSNISSELAEAATWIRSVASAGRNLTVIQTPPGRATVLALAIDHSRWPEVIGTIAGDDTIFIATRGQREQVRLEERLRDAGKDAMKLQGQGRNQP